jgi:nucleoside-diphosphate-sugar epimerase
MSSVSITSIQDLVAIYYICSTIHGARLCVMMSASRCMSRSMKYLILLACPASPIHYQTDPVRSTKTSVHGAINMLGLAKRVKAKILQASTSEIYGDPAVHPQPEEYWGNVNPVGPRSCYDEGKRCAETLFFDTGRVCSRTAAAWFEFHHSNLAKQ